MMARWAQSEIEPMITMGIASSNGQGVAMTSTAGKRLTAREHQHDGGAGEIFAERDGCNDGHSAEQIGTEFPPSQLPQQVVEQRRAADHERNQQGNTGNVTSHIKCKAKHQMRRDAHDGKECNDRGLALPEDGGRIPGANVRSLFRGRWSWPLSWTGVAHEKVMGR